MTRASLYLAGTATLALAASPSPAAGQDVLNTPPPALADRTTVGGDWDVLNGPFDLAALGTSRAARYQLERTNLVVDRRGGVLAREVTSAVFRREPVGEGSGARFSFERFTAGRQAGAAPLQMQEVPLPGTPVFELDTATFALSMIADVPAPETNAAEFRVLVVDALTWDLVRLQVGPGAVELGQNVTLDRPSGPQPVPGGTYEMGPGTLRIAGITRLRGEPCLQVSFAIEGSKASMESGGVNLEGQEYIRGTLVVSLGDGRIVAGQLWGPVIATFSQTGGQELPIGSILQYVTLREITPGESPQ